MTERIFVSSVQKELAAERRAIAELVARDPLFERVFRVFLFEDLPPRDRRADDVYLETVAQCALFVAVYGDDYGGGEDGAPSAIEREFDRATAAGIPRLVFVKGDDRTRSPRMQALVQKATSQLIRRRFATVDDLLRLLRESLVEHLERKGIVQSRPPEERPCAGATLDDVDAGAVAAFVRRARQERQFPLGESTAVADVLAHLNLLAEGQPSVAAILLFGSSPQRFVPAAELRCMHFHGTVVARPAPSYQVFKGRLAELVDRGADFVLGTLHRSVGTRAESTVAPAAYEIPPDVVREAIVNAIAHRDYASSSAVQLSVFADRVEVWNPGELPPPLTPERLRQPHQSLARNPRICEVLFLARYIEKYGTGTLMMARQCAASGLADPAFEQQGGQFTVTLWRDWLTDAVLGGLDLTDRQRAAVARVKTDRRIDNAAYQRAFGVSKPTATRDLDDLVGKGVLEKVGTTGKGTFYRLGREGLTKGSMGSGASGPGTKAGQGLTKGSKGSGGSGGSRAGVKRSPAKSKKPRRNT